MTWFERMMGFSEGGPETVRANASTSGMYLTSHVNNARYKCGILETPTLEELREVCDMYPRKGITTVNEIVADVAHLHDIHPNAMFQVASQFGLLEMPTPHVVPEDGLGSYEDDRTQGPICAMACAAGLIYRNYFVEVNGRRGQSFDNQINCADGLEKALDNDTHNYWTMQNGYMMVNDLSKLNSVLQPLTEEQLDGLRKVMKIGIQWDTQVTRKNAHHSVSQAYCSTVPMAYLRTPFQEFENLAQLLLDTAYESTLCAGVLNSIAYKSDKLFLTLIGGDAFGNKPEWIINAIRRALELHRNSGLDVSIVSYGTPNPLVQQLIAEYDADT